MSRGGLVEAVQEPVEDLLAAYLAFVRGVVALPLQGRPELDGGHEECARLADGLEMAIEFNWPGAVTVAQHAAVCFPAELSHLGAFGICRQLPGLVVKRFYLLGDGEVFVG